VNKKYLILISLSALTLGAWLLWVDYSFTIFGEHGFGSTKILDTVKTLYVGVVLIILGAIGLIKMIRRK